MADELAKVEGGPLTVPDFLKDEKGGEGFDKMDSTDLVIPRLCLTQGLTREKKRTNPNYIEGLVDGDLFNSVSGQIYGGVDRPVQVIPLQFGKSRIFFKPLEDGGGIQCRSANAIDGGTLSKTCATCEHEKYGGGCTLFNNYIAVLLPQKELIVVSLKSTGLKVARQWNARMKMLGGNKPMFAGVYEIRIVEARNAKGEFYMPSIALKRFVNEQEFKFAKDTFNTLAGRTVVMHEAGLNEDAEAAAAPSEDIPF